MFASPSVCTQPTTNQLRSYTRRIPIFVYSFDCIVRKYPNDEMSSHSGQVRSLRLNGEKEKENGIRKEEEGLQNVYQISRVQEIAHAKEWNVSISGTTNSGNHCSSGKCKSDNQRENIIKVLKGP